MPAPMSLHYHHMLLQSSPGALCARLRNAEDEVILGANGAPVCGIVAVSAEAQSIGCEMGILNITLKPTDEYSFINVTSFAAAVTAGPGFSNINDKSLANNNTQNPVVLFWSLHTGDTLEITVSGTVDEQAFTLVIPDINGCQDLS